MNVPEETYTELTPPVTAVLLGRTDTAYWWSRRAGNTDGPLTINDLFIWHDCQKVYSADLDGSAPEFDGMRRGWTLCGVGAHTLVNIDPLTITASVYWPDCCGRHGFITDGVWRDA